MSDDFQFKCSVCGELFDPDPAMVTDGEITPEIIPEGASVPNGAFSREDIETMSDEELMEAGIEPEDRAKLLNAEAVPCHLIICRACQDRMIEEEDEE